MVNYLSTIHFSFEMFRDRRVDPRVILTRKILEKNLKREMDRRPIEAVHCYKSHSHTKSDEN